MSLDITRGRANCANCIDLRMLEDPSYDQVVRWGNEGDSFVVLEVGIWHYISTCDLELTEIERKIYEVHSSQAF